MTAARTALVLFARAPRLGGVKTRLQPQLSPEQSLTLHRALVRDAVRLVRDFARGEKVTAVISFSEALPASEDLAGCLGDLDVTTQVGDDLGERLVRAFQERLTTGARRVVVIGSDSPTLGLDYLRAAFAALQDHEMVIGPAEDGGYLLIGCARLHVRPFQRIPWGTDRVLAETKRRLRRERIDFTLLRSGHDLDTVDDLVRTYRELEHREKIGAPSPAPHTLEVLREIVRGRPWLAAPGA